MNGVALIFSLLKLGRSGDQDLEIGDPTKGKNCIANDSQQTPVDDVWGYLQRISYLQGNDAYNLGPYTIRDQSGDSYVCVQANYQFLSM